MFESDADTDTSSLFAVLLTIEIAPGDGMQSVRNVIKNQSHTRQSETPAPPTPDSVGSGYTKKIACFECVLELFFAGTQIPNF